MQLLSELGWDATGLAEDTEFGAKCVSIGIYPEWAHEARVFDEKPVTIMASLRQRLRWMQGHFSCAETYAVPLIKKSIRERNLAKFDAAVYLFQPASFIVVFLTAVVYYLQLASANSTLLTGMLGLFPNWFWLTINILILLQIPLALFLERVNWRAYLAIPLFPVFLLTWFPVTLLAVFTRHNKNWVHTKHTRSISLEEMK